MKPLKLSGLYIWHVGSIYKSNLVVVQTETCLHRRVMYSGVVLHTKACYRAVDFQEILP